MKKYAVLGLAKSGIAAAYKLKKLGYHPFLSELRLKSEIKEAETLEENFDCEFGKHSEKLFSFDTIIVSPGIPLQSAIIKKLKEQNIELISEIEFGYRIKHPDSKIIAITGSNGKSTTVSLIHHILKSAGYQSVLGGNIGTAFTSFPIENEGIEFIVLEVSSFQLDLIETFHPQIAAILNITPDHLNRYKNFEEYIHSKFNIFRNYEQRDVALLNSSDKVISKYSRKLDIQFKYFGLHDLSEFLYNPYGFSLNDFEFSLKKSGLKGIHNVMNCMAAILATAPYISDYNQIQRAIDNFVLLPHRLEIFYEKNGISYVNDSKATNTDSVKYSLSSFDKPVRIILGGSDKGEDFSALIPFLQKNAKKIYLIGETQKKMEKNFSGICELETFATFNDCVQTAISDSTAGDIVLLAPACASYDMFKNYEERGEKFKLLVRELS